MSSYYRSRSLLYRVRKQLSFPLDTHPISHVEEEPLAFTTEAIGSLSSAYLQGEIAALMADYPMYLRR